jgi:hypothetical protein
MPIYLTALGAWRPLLAIHQDSHLGEHVAGLAEPCRLLPSYLSSTSMGVKTTHGVREKLDYGILRKFQIESPVDTFSPSSVYICSIIRLVFVSCADRKFDSCRVAIPDNVWHLHHIICIQYRLRAMLVCTYRDSAAPSKLSRQKPSTCPVQRECHISLYVRTHEK